MNGENVALSLTPEEWRIVTALREVPPSAGRDLAVTVIRELLELVQQPHCAQAQADGVPCESASNDCEQCRHVEQVLAALRAAVAARPGAG